MKKVKLTLLFILIILFVVCCNEKITKSPYISNFLGKYSITENYLFIDYNNDTIIDTTYYYTLTVEETKNNNYDIQSFFIHIYNNKKGSR